MRIYHEISKESFDTVVKDGLKCSTSGSKSNEVTLRVDTFLDQHIPEDLQKVGISRKGCIYGYLGDNEMVIDIKTGQWKPIISFISKPETAFLRLDVNESDCYVSDLTRYDAIKSVIQNGKLPAASQAISYWNALMKLKNFTMQPGVRPEVMIPQNISPKNIDIVPH